METITNADIRTAFLGGAEQFWQKLLEGMSVKIPTDPYNRDVFDMALLRAMDTSKQRMQAHSAMLASEPSRYMIKAVGVMIDQFESVTRELDRQTAAQGRTSSSGNVESEMALMKETANALLESTFANELAYLEAMERGNFARAKELLHALELIRMGGDNLLLKTEVLNWSMELSTKIGDIDMFLSTLGKASDLRVLLAPDAIKGLVGKLFSARGFDRIGAALTAEGKRACLRHVKGERGFMLEHLTVFSNSFALQVAEELCKNPKRTVAEFDNLMRQAFDDSRRSFLAVNPYFQTIVRS